MINNVHRSWLPRSLPLAEVMSVQWGPLGNPVFLADLLAPFTDSSAPPLPADPASCEPCFGDAVGLLSCLMWTSFPGRMVFLLQVYPPVVPRWFSDRTWQLVFLVDSVMGCPSPRWVVRSEDPPPCLGDVRSSFRVRLLVHCVLRKPLRLWKEIEFLSAHKGPSDQGTRLPKPGQSSLL